MQNKYYRTAKQKRTEPAGQYAEQNNEESEPDQQPHHAKECVQTPSDKFKHNVSPLFKYRSTKKREAGAMMRYILD